MLTGLGIISQGFVHSGAVTLGVGAVWSSTPANLRTKILDFRGFGSSIILCLRGGIRRSVESYRKSPGKFESTNLSRDNLSEELGRKPRLAKCQANDNDSNNDTNNNDVTNHDNNNDNNDTNNSNNTSTSIVPGLRCISAAT